MNDLILLLKDVDFSNIYYQIMTPLIFSLADIATGFIQAVINNDVNSQKMRNRTLAQNIDINYYNTCIFS